MRPRGPWLTPLVRSFSPPLCSAADAAANLGESEVREALLAKAVWLVKIGDKVSCRRSLTSLLR